MIKVRIAKKVKRSDAGDVSPVAMFNIMAPYMLVDPGNDLPRNELKPKPNQKYMETMWGAAD